MSISSVAANISAIPKLDSISQSVGNRMLRGVKESVPEVRKIIDVVDVKKNIYKFSPALQPSVSVSEGRSKWPVPIPDNRLPPVVKPVERSKWPEPASIDPLPAEVQETDNVSLGNKKDVMPAELPPVIDAEGRSKWPVPYPIEKLADSGVVRSLLSPVNSGVLPKPVYSNMPTKSQLDLPPEMPRVQLPPVSGSGKPSFSTLPPVIDYAPVDLLV